MVKTRKPDPVGDVFGWFRTAWQTRYRGAGWAPEAGVRTNVVAMLAGLEGLPDAAAAIAGLPAAMARYMADERRHLVEAKHPLRLFCQDVNKYRLEAAAEPKTAVAVYGRL